MKYFKLIWSEDPVINDIPGFVWPDAQNAIAHYDDFIGWTYGDTETPHLYEMDGPKATQSPVAFTSRLSHDRRRRPPRPLDRRAAKEALDYFSQQDPEFFGMNTSSEQDVLLFIDLAATVGVLKSAYNPVLDEYFIGIPTEMRKIR